MRRPATDAPVQKPHYQHGVISAVISERLYQVNTGEETRLATYDKGVLAVDTEVDIRMLGERNHWRIEYATPVELEEEIFTPSPIWHEYGASPNGPFGATFGIWIGRTLASALHEGAATLGLGARNIQTRRSVWFPDDEIVFWRVDVESANNGNWLYRSFNAGEAWLNADFLKWGFATGNLGSDLIYERWFDPTAPNWVHMFKKQDFGDRGIYYNRYDKDTNTLLYGSTGIRCHDNSGGGPWTDFFAARSLSGRLYAWGPFNFRDSTALSLDGGVTWAAFGTLAFAAPPVSRSNSLPAYGFPDHESSNPDDILIIVPEAVSFNPNTCSICRYNATANTWSETVFWTGEWTSSADENGIRYSAVYDRENGHIYFSLWTSDDGIIKTWDIYGSTATPRTAVDNNATNYVRDPALTILENGRIICFYSKDITGTSGTSTQVVARYSDDKMLTWQDMDPYIWSAREYDNSNVYVDPAPIRGLYGKQVFMGGSVLESTGGTIPGNVRTVPLAAWRAGSTTNNATGRTLLLTESGILNSLQANLATAPGGSSTRTLQVSRINSGSSATAASATALSVVFGSADTYKENLTTHVPIVAGDVLAIRSSRGSAVQTGAWWSTDFIPTNKNRRVWGGSTDVRSVATAFHPVGAHYGGDWPYGIPWGIAGRMKRWAVRLYTAKPAGQDITFTLYHNDVATSATVVIPGGSTYTGILEIDIPFNEKDTWKMQCVDSAGSAHQGFSYGVSYEPEIEGQWNISGVSVSLPDDGGFLAFNSISADLSTEAFKTVRAGRHPLTFNGMYVKVPSVPPGGTDSLTYTLRKSGVDTALTATLTGSELEKEVGGTVSSVDGDYFTMRGNVTPTANGGPLMWTILQPTNPFA